MSSSTTSPLFRIATFTIAIRCHHRFVLLIISFRKTTEAPFETLAEMTYLQIETHDGFGPILPDFAGSKALVVQYVESSGIISLECLIRLVKGVAAVEPVKVGVSAKSSVSPSSH